MKLTAAQSSKLNAEFSEKLNAVLQAFRDRALAQFKYNLETNVPKNILKPDEVVEQAIRLGFIGGAASLNQFGIEPSLQLAAEILEDVNAHTEAAPLFAALKKMQEDNS